MRSVYSFITEPKGDIYRSLLDYSLNDCQYFQLIVRRDWDLSEKGKSAVEKLNSFLIKKEEVSEWPGTKMFGGTVTLLQFVLSLQSVKVLSQLTSGLYSYLYPHFFEDLSMLRPDGEPWLISIAHEKDGYLVLSDIEFQNITAAIPCLRDILKEDGSSSF
jgi:hypothetical protein